MTDEGNAGERYEAIDFPRVGMLVWGKPPYTNEGPAGDVRVAECGRCKALTASPADHAREHVNADRRTADAVRRTIERLVFPGALKATKAPEVVAPAPPDVHRRARLASWNEAASVRGGEYVLDPPFESKVGDVIGLGAGVFRAWRNRELIADYHDDGSGTLRPAAPPGDGGTAP